jgi:hypothetical protein
MTNSWQFEINKRSPAYLSDLDKLYVALAFGYGKNQNSLNALTGAQSHRWGYSVYNNIDYRMTDFSLNIYSQLGSKTFGSLFATYGSDRNQTTKDDFLRSIPNRLDVKTAFAWRLRHKLTLGVSGRFSNYPKSYVFALQPTNTSPYENQVNLPVNVGQTYIGESDLMYRTDEGIDFILGGKFQYRYSKFFKPDDVVGDGLLDTAEVKEHIYSGAPKVMVKKTFPSGSFIRGGASYYFNLFDYQYLGGGNYPTVNTSVPSYRSQQLSTMIPNWELFVDGSKVIGPEAVVYSSLRYSNYPNRLTRSETDWIPIDLSLVNADNLNSVEWLTDVSGKLTRILHGLAGVRVRYLNPKINSQRDPLQAVEGNVPLDNRSVYVSLRLGTTTRFYRSLWWSVRLEDLHLYSTKEVGTASLFENRTFIETEVLLLGF